MKFAWRKSVKAALTAVCLIALIVAARLWYLEEQGNFHPITPGEAYRSAQLDRDEWEYYIRKYNIRSIVNLRGKNPGEPWYAEEIATSRKWAVSHFDLRLNSDKTPSSSEIKKSLEMFRLAPRPVLIHCRAGADRTGLAAAIWKIVVDGESDSVAGKELSIFYGHMPVGPTRVLDEFFDTWSSALKGSMNTDRMTGGLLQTSIGLL